jgi:hypothetical protein
MANVLTTIEVTKFCHYARYSTICITKRGEIDANCHAISSEHSPREHALTAAPPSSTLYLEEGDMKHVSTKEGTGVGFVLASGIFHCSADTSSRAGEILKPLCTSWSLSLADVSAVQ